MSRSAPALPASAVALQSIFMTYASCPAEGPPFLDAERFIDLLEACPDLLTADFTMDQAMDVFDAVTEESDPGLSLEQFLAALSDIAEERYPEQGACHALVVGRAAWTHACIARALALTRSPPTPHLTQTLASRMPRCWRRTCSASTARRARRSPLTRARCSA